LSSREGLIHPSEPGQTSVFEPPRAVRNRAWWWTRSKTFGSLSQIAKAMTGTNWNGHRFFGLRQGKTSAADVGTAQA
jgi:hypothetical protein